jgi:hypothetical protein
LLVEFASATVGRRPQATKPPMVDVSPHRGHRRAGALRNCPTADPVPLSSSESRAARCEVERSRLDKGPRGVGYSSDFIATTRATHRKPDTEVRVELNIHRSAMVFPAPGWGSTPGRTHCALSDTAR